MSMKLTADTVTYDARSHVLTVDGETFPVMLTNLEHLLNRPNQEDEITITFAFRTFTLRSKNE